MPRPQGPRRRRVHFCSQEASKETTGILYSKVIVRGVWKAAAREPLRHHRMRAAAAGEPATAPQALDVSRRPPVDTPANTELAASQSDDDASFVDPEGAQAGSPTHVVKVERKPATCARITWASFHGLGLLLLWLSGSWPFLSNWPFGVLAGLTLATYAAAGLMDPGYLPRPTDVAIAKPAPSGQASSGLNAFASPLLDLPECTHCGARQVARAKVHGATSTAALPYSALTAHAHPFQLKLPRASDSSRP
jgi:hypothetical protein